ncbi:hypothetical protein M8C21_001933, partial [Ambrosia artemisiifolia]
VAYSLYSKWASVDTSSHLNPTSTGPFVPKKFVVRCHTNSNYSSLSTTMSSDLKSNFMQVYDSIKFDLLHDPSFEFDDDSSQWVERMIDYNVLGGKMIRGLGVVESYQLLKTEKLTDDEIFLASVLGWCIEWLQAYLLVHDDIIDDSYTRRGHSCWFRLPEVGMVAVNDGLILRSQIPMILKNHFNKKAYYVNLLDLFSEVEFKTISGQMIDATTKLVGEKNLSKYSMSTYHRIVQYKSSYYSLYLPVACALLMLGENLDDHVQMNDVLVEMGIYGQMQNDYHDTFGDPNEVCKVGSDIENSTCSWLIAKALQLANEEQKKLLCENYGTKDPARVAKVIDFYHALNLKGVYEDFENKTHKELIKSIETLPSKRIQEVLKSLLGKMIRGLGVVESYQLLKTEKLTDDEIFLASVLGWCIEWLQAYLLVHDDIIDDSYTRRGHSCWFRLPEVRILMHTRVEDVGMVAVNDGLILRSQIPMILKKHFNKKAYYVNLLDLFSKVEFQTISCQMIDATTNLVGEKNLSKYSTFTYHRIVQYKSSYYSLYLPVACALLMLGENLDDHVQMNDVLVEMGIYGQMQNDYHDTFGDPNEVCKVGSDIENSTCSWLIAKALQLANKEQKKLLCENYGTKDPARVAKVIELYDALNLKGVYEDFENKTHKELIKSIETLPSKRIQEVLKSLLGAKRGAFATEKANNQREGSRLSRTLVKLDSQSEAL